MSARFLILGRTASLVVAFAALVMGCGSRSTSGNPGSETHWLGACRSDADCGVGQCACGVCTKPCEVQSDCALGAGVSAECRASGAAEQCSDEQSLSQWCLSANGTDEPMASTAPTVSSPPTTSAPTQSTPPITSEPPPPDPTATMTTPTVSVPVDPPPPPDAGPPEVICDDSDTVRFLSNTDGGFVDQYYAFMEYGHQLLAIDGRCNYWVTTAADGLVRTGQVTEAEAQDLALQASYGNWDLFGDYRGDDCADGAGSVLWDSESAILCACACNGEGAPAGYPEAFAAARMLSTDLFAMGTPSADGLQLLVVSDAPERFSDEGVAWPLDWDPASVAIANEESFNISAESGQFIDDEAEATLLRAMRAEYVANLGVNNYQAVHAVAAAGDGGMPQHYLVFLRDDVPAAVRAARIAARDAAYAQ